MDTTQPIPRYENDCYITYNSPLRELVFFRTEKAIAQYNSDLYQFVKRHFEMVKEREFYRNLVRTNTGALADNKDEPVPEFCNIMDVLRIVMEKADPETKGRMIMTCRTWATWLLPSGPGRLRDVHGETLTWGLQQNLKGLWVTVYRGMEPIAWEFQEDRKLLFMPALVELPFVEDWDNINPADFLDDEDIGLDDEEDIPAAQEN